MSRRRILTKSQNKSRAIRRSMRTISGVANTAHTALRLATSIAGLINVEFKGKDISNTGLSPDTTGAIILVSQIAQGDGDHERDGMQVKLKSIQAVVQATKHASATTTFLRCGFVMDTQVGGGTAITDLFGSSPNIRSFVNFDQRKRWIILKNWDIELGDRTMATVRWHKNQDLELQFNDTGASAIQNHAIYFYHISSEATNTPSLHVNVRLRYLDN